MEEMRKDLFVPATADAAESEKISKPSLSLWKDAMLRFRANKLAMVGLTIIFIVVMLAIFVPVFSKYDYSTTDLLNADQPPSKEHWFGTDDLGRDMFVRTWVGARISIFIGLAAAVLDVIIGIIWGSIAAFKGGRTDGRSDDAYRRRFMGNSNTINGYFNDGCSAKRLINDYPSHDSCRLDKHGTYRSGTGFTIEESRICSCRTNIRCENI